MANTTNFGWTKPTVGGSADTWGTILNTLFDAIDANVFALSPASPGTIDNMTIGATTPKVGTFSSVGIGTNAPAYGVDFTKSVNGVNAINITNANAGVSAAGTYRLSNGTHGAAFSMTGASYTPTVTYDFADGVFLESDGAGGVNIATTNATPIRFFTGGAPNPAERVRIDSNGNVGIGMTPVFTLDITKSQASTSKVNLLNANTGGAAAVVANADTGTVYIAASGSAQGGTTYAGLSGNNQVILEAESASSFYIGTTPACPIVLAQNRVEMARLTNSGQLLIGATAALGAEKQLVSQSAANVGTVIALNTNATPSAACISNWTFSAAAPNNTTALFGIGSDSGTTRLVFYSNGGIANYSANNVNLSDERVKGVFSTYGASDLDALEHAFVGVNWGKFRYSDQSHQDWNHGYTAQGVETAFAGVAPELVDTTELGPDDEPGLKGVYETDLTNIGLALLARALKRISVLEAQAAARG